jgi:NAD(P)-dependent dehydrogenase (short-subunit alcohol dehydrogenase family)
MTTIAVTAATGQLGRAALEHLRSRAPGARLIALARDPARVGPGTEARAFDYSRPDTLAPPLPASTRWPSSPRATSPTARASTATSSPPHRPQAWAASSIPRSSRARPRP